MPIANSIEQARQLAAIEHKLKLSLENSFMPPLRRYLRDLAREFKLYYTRSGSGFQTSEFDQELATILKAHYRRVSNAFKLGVRTQDNADMLDDEIDSAIKAYNDPHSLTQAQIINETNQKEFNKYTLAALASLAETGRPLTNRSVAEEAAKTFNSHVVPKSQLISTTETQNIAETTKGIEESIMLGSAISGLAGVQFEKLWVSVLDNRTRHNHAIADGQRRLQAEPFLVGGERMNFPGDTSLGASLENIINCRCSSILLRL